jgi:hypothetical protein
LIDLMLIFGVFAAFLPASALLMRGAGAYLLAPVISIVASLIATFIHILLDIPIMWGWLVLVILQVGLLVVPSLRRQLIANLKISKTDTWGISALSVSAIASLGAVISTPAPLAWDARSIWFHHALWLNGPALYFWEAQFLPVGNWPDYPFTGPGLMALLWQLTGGGSDLWLASSVIGVSVVMVATLTGFLLGQKFAPKAHWAFKTLGLLVFVTAVTFLADGYYNAGYQDTFQAVAVGLVLALVLNLDKQDAWKSLIPAAIAFILAANIKQEGFWFAFGVLVLGLVVQAMQRNWKSLLLIPFALAIRAGWSLFQDYLGMPDNGHTSEVVARIPALLTGDKAVYDNLAMVANLGIGPRSGGYLALVVLAGILIAVFYRPSSLAIRVVTPIVTLSAPIGVLAVAVLTYALGQSGGLEWWLGTSYTRITATFELLALFAVLSAAFALLPETKPKVVVQLPQKSGKSKKRKR